MAERENERETTGKSWERVRDKLLGRFERVREWERETIRRGGERE